MASEKFANQIAPVTTLSSSYTSGGSSIVVVSATGFPSTGIFRVRLGNTNRTLFRVDSVSGTTFTGAAEANDANAAAGDAVRAVASRGTAERFLQSPDSDSIHSPSGISGGDFYGPIYKMRGVVASEFSWVNQGAAVETVLGGVARLQSPSQAQNVRARMKSFPSSNFTVSICCIPHVNSTANAAEVGLIFRESGTDKWQGWRLASDGGLYVTNWTAANAIVANQYVGAGDEIFRKGGLFWLRVLYDGTNVKYYDSYEGVHWILRLTEAKNARFTTAPDQVGYYANDRTTVGGPAISVLSWLET